MGTLIEIVNEHEFKATPVRYAQRVVLCFKTTIIFYAFIFFGIGIMSSFVNGLYVVLFFFILNLLEYRNWSRYYITHIKKSGNNLHIEYYDKDEQKVIEDTNTTFTFKTNNVWYKIRSNTPFLIISHAENTILKQFLITDIDESVIKKIASLYGV